MKLLLIVFGKPLIGLVAGAGLWSFGLAEERAVQVQEVQLRAVEAQQLLLEDLQDEAKQVRPEAGLDDAHEHKAEEQKAEKIQPDE